MLPAAARAEKAATSGSVGVGTEGVEAPLPTTAEELSVARGDYILESLAAKSRAETVAESTALTSSTLETTRAALKVLMIEGLNLEGMTPEMIEDDQPVFGEGLGLDSIDALELMVMIEKEFGVTIEGREIDPETFSSVASLARFVEGLRAEQGKPASA